MYTFDEMWAIAGKINGPLTKDEARILWNLAALSAGDVVEIGCEYGQATVLLAGGGPTICAERWNRGTCHQDQYLVWRKNVLDSGVASNVEILEADSSYHTWESPIGLLYVDMPSSDTTLRHINGWAAHMQRGAVLCVRGTLTPPSGFRIEKMVGGLTIYRKP